MCHFPLRNIGGLGALTAVVVTEYSPVVENEWQHVDSLDELTGAKLLYRLKSRRRL